METKELIERILKSSGMTEKDIIKEKESYKKSDELYKKLIEALKGE